MLTTGDIGLLKIVSESGVAAGVRRIEAFTGQSALTYTNQQASSLTQIASLVKSDVSNVNSKVEALISRSKHLEKQVSLLKQELAAQAGSDLLNQAITIEGIKVLIADLGGVESKALRGMVDELKNKMHSGIIMLATTNGAKVGLIAGVTKDLTSRVKAGELVNMVAEQVGGKGGGRPDMAQAGGSIPENITEALASVSPWLQEKLR
jgi:alanyl-tRNA synthetase